MELNINIVNESSSCDALPLRVFLEQPQYPALKTCLTALLRPQRDRSGCAYPLDVSMTAMLIRVPFIRNTTLLELHIRFLKANAPFPHSKVSRLKSSQRCSVSVKSLQGMLTSG